MEKFFLLLNIRGIRIWNSGDKVCSRSLVSLTFLKIWTSLFGHTVWAGECSKAWWSFHNSITVASLPNQTLPNQGVQPSHRDIPTFEQFFTIFFAAFLINVLLPNQGVQPSHRDIYTYIWTFMIISQNLWMYCFHTKESSQPKEIYLHLGIHDN